MNAIVYKLTSPSGKSFIGKDLNPGTKYADFLNTARYFENPKINNARTKYGTDKFKVEILFQIEDNDAESLYKRSVAMEKMFIVMHNTIEDGYNMTDEKLLEFEKSLQEYNNIIIPTLNKVESNGKDICDLIEEKQIVKSVKNTVKNNNIAISMHALAHKDIILQSKAKGLSDNEIIKLFELHKDAKLANTNENKKLIIERCLNNFHKDLLILNEYYSNYKKGSNKGKLTSKNRPLVQQYFKQGKSVEEIVKILNVSEALVKTYIKELNHDLKKLF